MRRFSFIKENLKTFLTSSIITILPIIAGLVLWNRLPDIIATHWGPQGVADGYSSKAFAVFALPSFLLAIHWICLFISCLDIRTTNQPKKALKLIFWICPVISFFVSYIMYSYALGFELNVAKFSVILFGMMFIIIGNYMPKIKQNRFLGIKLPWTLKNEENWNMTHRFSGRLWVAGGIISILFSFIPTHLCFLFFMADVFLMVLIPTLYSYIYHKKQSKS